MAMTALLAAFVWSRANWRLVLAGLAAVALLLAVWWLFTAGRHYTSRPGRIGRP